MLTIIRLLQGMSLGGEFSGSITYIVEHAPQNRRGLAGAAALVSMMLGFLLGLLTVKAMLALLGEAEFAAWGWRLPFLFGIIVGLVGFYIRNNCEESPIYDEAKQQGGLSEKPVREAFSGHLMPMLQGFAIYITVTMPFYLTTVYFIGFSKNHLAIPADQALLFSVYNMLALLLMMPLSAWLSDYVGRKKIMSAAALLMFIAAYPLFGLMQPGADSFTIGMAQLIFACILGIYVGPVAALLVELFPTSVRFTGMAISYNFSAAIFGGTAPMVCEWLIGRFGDARAIACYVMLSCAITLLAFFFYRDRFREEL